MKRIILILVFISLVAITLAYFYREPHTLENPLPDMTSLDTLIQMQVDTTVVVMNDTMMLQKTIKGFLTWYKVNYAKANGFKLTYADAKGNYQVDSKECEKYLQFLKSSGHISESYIVDWRKYFDSKVEYFKDNIQNEGPPEGFSMDLVLITQEPELILNAIDKLKFKTKEIDDSSAVIEVTGESMYEFELSKKDGLWKIDYISTENYD